MYFKLKRVSFFMKKIYCSIVSVSEKRVLQLLFNKSLIRLSLIVCLIKHFLRLFHLIYYLHSMQIILESRHTFISFCIKRLSSFNSYIYNTIQLYIFSAENKSSS